VANFKWRNNYYSISRCNTAILAKSDRTQQLMSQNYEENDRETIVRTRGIQ